MICEQQQQIIAYAFLVDCYVDLLFAFISENGGTVSAE